MEGAKSAQKRAMSDDVAIKEPAGALRLTFCELQLTNWPA
jgi:hypothetical protein